MILKTERDVLVWRLQGFTIGHIAHGLCVSTSTVRDRIERANQKIELHRE